MIKSFLAALALLVASVSAFAVDVNKATAAELDAIKGIGPGIAGKILDERKKGSFKSWDDLIERVNGVGEGNAAKFSSEGLTVGGANYKGAKPAAAAAAPAKAAAPAAAPAAAAATPTKAAANDPTMKKDEKAAAAKDAKPAKEDKSAMADKKADKKADKEDKSAKAKDDAKKDVKKESKKAKDDAMKADDKKDAKKG
jgi:competence protein ComEA